MGEYLNFYTWFLVCNKKNLLLKQSCAKPILLLKKEHLSLHIYYILWISPHFFSVILDKKEIDSNWFINVSLSFQGLIAIKKKCVKNKIKNKCIQWNMSQVDMNFNESLTIIKILFKAHYNILSFLVFLFFIKWCEQKAISKKLFLKWFCNFN